MRQGGKNYSDMGHGLFLNSTCNIGENKQQGHATLLFFNFDTRHWGPHIKGPLQGWQVRRRLAQGGREDMQDSSQENEVNLWVDLMKKPNLVQPFLQRDLIPPEGYRGCSMELGG